MSQVRPSPECQLRRKVEPEPATPRYILTEPWIGYRPSNRAHDGRWRSIEVKVDRLEVKARTRRGYRLAKTSK